MQIKFRKQYGKGTDPWYAKAERWVYKKFKNPFLQHLAMGFIEWLKQKWIDIKIENTMTDVDRQVKEIKEEWDEEDRKQFAPEYTETPSEVEGLNDMSISFSTSKEEDPS
jgi:hypothetical protein